MNIPRLILQLLFGHRLPTTSGTLEIPGLARPILIRRDGYGIPYIEAETEEDAWYGLGFCQGQDRAFQLEGLLRIVRGTLAELTGAVGLPIDRLSRRIGFLRSAEAQLPIIDPQVRGVIQAFAQGATAGARLGGPKPAHEFALLRAEPTPYQPADVLGVLKLQSFLLASNWDVELVRLKILSEDGPEAVAALDPAYPDWLPATGPPGVAAGPVVDRLAEDLNVFTATAGYGGGSNNWALAAERTATGRPLVANDPHLAPLLPPHWYLAHVRTPDWAAAGACFAGAPGFPVGHNGFAAWGVTAGLVDNTDLFLEEIDPEERTVRQGDDFIPCEVRREVIQVKGGAPVEEEVLITPRGPIVGPALAGEPGAISLRATWLDPRPAAGLLQLHRATSFEAFRRTFEQWPALSLNVVYGDTSGCIGWQLVGEAPRRRKGWGTLPLPGWSRETGWTGEIVPFDEMPHLSNPATGFVATANNQPTQADGGPFLGIDWIDGYRLARIVEALDSRRDWDLPGTQRLQIDQKSIPWQELRDLILAAPVPPGAGEARQALSLLEAWDGVLGAGSPAAAVFELWLAEMIRRVVAARAPRAAEWALGAGFTPLAPNSILAMRRTGHLVRLLREQPEGWFERSWPEEMADALAAAVHSLKGRFGSDPQRWAWGQVRQLTLIHPVGSRPPLSRVFNLGPFPWGGDANTVGQAAAPPADPTANPVAIASLRMVVDVGNWEASRFALPGGQSGNPFSPHYADQLPFWQRGEGIPIAWSPAAVERATAATLRLVPARD